LSAASSWYLVWLVCMLRRWERNTVAAAATAWACTSSRSPLSDARLSAALRNPTWEICDLSVLKRSSFSLRVVT